MTVNHIVSVNSQTVRELHWISTSASSKHGGVIHSWVEVSLQRLLSAQVTLSATSNNNTWPPAYSLPIVATSSFIPDWHVTLRVLGQARNKVIDSDWRKVQRCRLGAVYHCRGKERRACNITGPSGFDGYEDVWGSRWRHKHSCTSVLEAWQHTLPVSVWVA